MLILKLIEYRLHHLVFPVDIIAGHNCFREIVVSHIKDPREDEAEKQRVVGIVPKEKIPAFIAEIQTQVVLFRSNTLRLQILRHQCFCVHLNYFLLKPIRVLVE